MVQVYQPYSLGSSIGRGLGKGLGEQMQREVGASLIGRELDNMRSKSGQMSQFDILKGLTTMSSRLSPEQGAALMKVAPQLMQELYRNQDLSVGDQDPRNDIDGAMTDTGPSGDTNRLQPSGQPAVTEPQDTVVDEVKAILKPGSLRESEKLKIYQNYGLADPATLETEEGIRAQTEKQFTFSPDERNRLIRNLQSRTNLSRSEAENQVDQYESRIRQGQQDRNALRAAQLDRQRSFETEFEKEANTLLQTGKDGLSSRLPGEVQASLRNQGIQMLKDNPQMSATQIAREVAQRANQFAKNREELTSRATMGQGSLTFTGAKSQKAYLDDMRKFRQAYADAGALDIFKDDLQSLGITPEYAAFYAYPTGQALTQTIIGLPKLESADPYADYQSQLADRNTGPKLRRAEKQLRESLQANFNPNTDSLLSVKASLYERGYPPDMLAGAVADLQNEGFDFGDRNTKEAALLNDPMGDSLANIMLKSFRSTLPYAKRYWRGITGGRFQGAGQKKI